MRRVFRKSALAFVAMAVFGSGVSAVLGQTWNNPSGGSYGTPTNWTPNGIPLTPVFNLNSAGYTVTLPSTETAQTLTVQTDNPTLSLSGQTFNVSEVNVSTLLGQTGSLTVLGPGGVIANSNNASVNVGGSGTGQLIVNAAAINFGGSNGTSVSEAAGSGITVENGGALENSISASLSGSLILNDGTLSDETDISVLGGATLSDHSTISAVGNMTFNGNISADDSTITSSNGVSMNFTGSLTLSDNASVSTTGIITLPATTTDLSGDVNSIANTIYSGLLTIQLDGSTNDPFSGASMGEYGGALDFTLANAFVPVVGEHFNIFDYLGGHTGVFSAVNLPALPGGESWDISHLYTTGVIDVVPEPTGMALLMAAAATALLRRRRSVCAVS